MTPPSPRWTGSSSNATPCSSRRARRPAAGRLPADVVSTLDVWDTKLSEAGEALAAAREALHAGLEPLVQARLRRLAAGVAHRGGPRSA